MIARDCSSGRTVLQGGPCIQSSRWGRCGEPPPHWLITAKLTLGWLFRSRVALPSLLNPKALIKRPVQAPSLAFVSESVLAAQLVIHIQLGGPSEIVAF